MTACAFTVALHNPSHHLPKTGMFRCVPVRRHDFLVAYEC